MCEKDDLVFADINGKKKRMIYYCNPDQVALSAKEQAFFMNFNSSAGALGLPKWWKIDDTLRLAHVVKLDVKKTEEVILN